MALRLPFQRASGPPAPEPVLPGKPRGLGTFGGVFTPSILTILGVIMYLRLGWVVGNAGLVGTWLIVSLSTAITLLTALSVSSIATDQRVRTGGAYYMISRSLGLETGGAVGIPLYIALALSVALYTVGFAESVVRVFPGLDQRWVGIATTVAVAALALVSARLAIRAQYLIMVAIGVSLASLVIGQGVATGPVQGMGPPAAGSEPFWVVFAVFFPAVTGIMAGVNMSGDLATPGRSIPRGTLAAVAVGFVVYMGLPLLLAWRADAATLIEDPLVMRRMALWGDAIVLGVWGATLSSAMGSILGAPRVLQALARDDVLPRWLRWLGSGSGPDDEPRLGTLVTLGVAVAAAALGDLNLIAPVLTMFFLTTYGVLNVAAGVERFLGSPSFRPRFRVPWSLSMLGALGCAAVMLLINPIATAVAVVVAVGIFVWLERRELTAAWGDVRRGVWMALTRSGLVRLRDAPDPKNWRPHLLVLSGAPTRRWHLIDFAVGLSHQRGMVTIASVVPEELVGDERRAALEATVRDYLDSRGVTALVRVARGENLYRGAAALVEHYGLGTVVPNTVLLGDCEDEERYDDYCGMIERFHAARRNVVIVHGGERGYGERRRIDVWWGGLQDNGGLMLLLAFLLRTSLAWRGSEVVLKMVVPDAAAAEGSRGQVAELVARTRIEARSQVIAAAGRSFDDIVSESSADADLVFLGVAEPGDDFPAYYRALLERAEPLPTTVFVLAAENLAFGQVLLDHRPAEAGTG